jgi:hypothetical protein
LRRFHIQRLPDVTAVSRYREVKMDAAKGQSNFNENSENLFSIFDYGVFISMLLLSALIGVYFGFISKKKQNNTAEYLLGSKQMGF